MEDKITFEVKLDKIEIFDFYIKSRPPITFSQAALEIDYNIILKNQINPDKKLVVQVLSIKSAVKGSASDELAGINLAVGYNIRNFDEAIQKIDNDTFFINDDLEARLRNVTFGTGRGIFYDKLQGTYLNQTVLPLVPDK